MNESELKEQIALREAWQTPAGRLIYQTALKFMIQLSKEAACDAQWLRGIGLLIAHLDETGERLERLKEP